MEFGIIAFFISFLAARSLLLRQQEIGIFPGSAKGFTLLYHGEKCQAESVISAGTHKKGDCSRHR